MIARLCMDSQHRIPWNAEFFAARPTQPPCPCRAAILDGSLFQAFSQDSIIHSRGRKSSFEAKLPRCIGTVIIGLMS